MARVEVPIVALNTTTGLPVAGASVQMKLRSSGLNATWWTQETGGTSSTAAIITDSAGRTNAWLDRGAYNAVISGSGITTYTEPWDASPGADNAIDALWLPDNIIASRHLADNVVGTAELSVTVQGQLNPIGTILAYALASAPTGYQMCDGSVGATAALLAALDTAGRPYGGGAGAGLVPDLRGRTPVGVDGAAGRLSASDALGNAAGVQTVALSEDEMPNNMIRSSGGATHFAYGGFDSTEFSAGQAVAMQVNGGGSAHNNMQPYQIVNFIIKT